MRALPEMLSPWLGFCPLQHKQSKAPKGASPYLATEVITVLIYLLKVANIFCNRSQASFLKKGRMGSFSLNPQRSNIQVF